MKFNSRFSAIPLFALSIVGLVDAGADVHVSKIFGDHMVLQQNQPIRVWGTADPEENVTVSLADESRSGKASAEGQWRIDLPAMPADGKAHTMTIKGSNTISLTDVWLGEVWLCSGQSNMEWSVKASMDAGKEIAKAKHTSIRLFNVPGHVAGPEPQDDPRGQWQICSPETIGDFSAVGYFFGRELAKHLDAPIGLVGTNWGGTRIEPWTPPLGFQQVEELKNYVENLEAIEEVKASGSEPPKPKGGAVQIYNGMVHALTPLSARGAIWYQGESNAGDGLRYEFMKEALVKGWRTVFENDELSFYWVQLANFREPIADPAGGGWGPVREGQRRALRIPNTGMAVIIDIGEAHDIHPRNKQDVGQRLALWALAKNYGQDVVYSGPLYKEMKKERNAIRISFDHVGSGLMMGRKEGLRAALEVPGSQLSHFAIQDASDQWHWAQARIDGETVLVWHENVDSPKNVRFGYELNPATLNLYNKEGLPASPFTTTD